MPGHKGVNILGFEKYDITEIKGADALFHADGIIAESEANASSLFDSGKTIYSTEGSSLSIKTMICLAKVSWEAKYKSANERPIIVAARNVHISFIHSCALLDIDVLWLESKEDSGILTCQINNKELEEIIKNNKSRIMAVYLTSPDYLGVVLDIESIADICHLNDIMLLVDNAHGAYLNFIDDSRYKHPLRQGADICSDSAHKTLPVVTGGAYLHLNKNLDKWLYDKAKYLMNIFASTSPSYLILQSLDKCNDIISNNYSEILNRFCLKIREKKKELIEAGLNLLEADPLKITLNIINADVFADKLRECNIEAEYADEDYLVLMLTPYNRDEELDYLCKTIIDCYRNYKANSIEKSAIVNNKKYDFNSKKVMSIREAVLGPSEKINVENSLGRICASPLVSCPPAIPIVVSGERIDEDAIRLFNKYNIEYVECVIQK